MKVTPVASPTAIQQAPSSGQSARDRAVAAYAAANQPVQNQNAVAPEEMAVIQPKHEVVSAQSDESTNTEPETQVPPPQEQDPELRKQFLQLARQEKVMRQKAQVHAQQLQEREAAIQAREAALESQANQYKTGYFSQERLKADPLSVLAEAGLSYEEITNQILTQQPEDPRMKATINKLQSQIEELKAANENTKKSYADNQTAAYQAAVKQIETDTRALVSNNPEYETIASTRSEKEVVELIKRTFDQDGILLSVEEAAQEVENYLIDEAMKLTNIKKVQKQWEATRAKSAAPAPSQIASKSPAQQQQQPAQMKTLTNAASSSRQLSAKERAILAFKGELKS